MDFNKNKKFNLKIINKVDLLFKQFNDNIKIDKYNDAYTLLYKSRLIHGKYLCKFGKIISNKKKCKKHFFDISSISSILNLINKKITDNETIFNNYIIDKKIDPFTLKITDSKSDSDSETSSESDLESDTKTSKTTQPQTTQPQTTQPQTTQPQTTQPQSVSKSDSKPMPLFVGSMSPESIKINKINSEINGKSLDKFNQNIPSLILFYRMGCPACEKTKPHWDNLIANIKTAFDKDEVLFNITELDLSDQSNEKLAFLFEVEYIPTIIMMESSKKPLAKIEKIEGAADQKRIQTFIKESYIKFNK
jgi:thiol-disulfide isomerase/thioredoxin